MTDSHDGGGTHRAPRLTIRTRHILGADGADQTATTVFCPVVERSVAVADCERCEKFHSLHFDPGSRITTLHCNSAGAPVAPEEEAALRDAAGGPVDPETPLAEIMTKEVVCVRADVDLEVIRDLMVERGFGGVPVVDPDGRPVGIISRADVLRSEHDREGGDESERVTAQPHERENLGFGKGFHVFEPAKVLARDVMSPLVLALHENSNIGQASSLMAYEGVHRLPVVADDGKVVGLLSSLDVLRWFGRRSGYLIPSGAVRRHG